MAHVLAVNTPDADDEAVAVSGQCLLEPLAVFWPNRLARTLEVGRVGRPKAEAGRGDDEAPSASLTGAIIEDSSDCTRPPMSPT